MNHHRETTDRKLVRLTGCDSSLLNGVEKLHGWIQAMCLVHLWLLLTNSSASILNESQEAQRVSFVSAFQLVCSVFVSGSKELRISEIQILCP